MLRTNVVMVEAVRLFLGEGQYTPGAFRELIESISHRGPSY